MPSTSPSTSAVSEDQLADSNRAIEAYERVLELMPHHEEALDTLAQIYRAHQRYSELLEILARIAAEEDRDRRVAAYFEQALIHDEMLAEPGLAAEAARQVLRLDPEHGPARLLASRDRS